MITEKVIELSKRVSGDIAGELAKIDEIAQANTEKVITAYQNHRVSETCFAGTTGYGYNDKGRETLNAVFAEIMNTESALVSAGFVNGTHAITAALFAALSPGQTLLSATGLPYDTLHGVIGISGDEHGSLKKYGITYTQIELKENGAPDIKALADYLSENPIGAVYIQRSRGYSERRAVCVDEIGEICRCTHSIDKNIPVIVDNCYGEFVETAEPGNVGADIVAGSLTKNPGGGLIPRGGYVAGKKALVDAAANRLSAPGIGAKCGAAPGGHRSAFQGLFMAPHTVAQAMKTAVFAARLFELMGYETSPGFSSPRSDIIQMIKLGSAELLERFCKGIQSSAPIDSYVTPIASDMPGYNGKVIMAAGTFIQGSTIELSADAPMREPYNVFLQGGLTFESGKYSIMKAASMI